jgi:hypothetical protein
MPNKDPQKQKENCARNHQERKEKKKFVQSFIEKSNIPGEVLTPTQLYCVFHGFDKDADPETVSKTFGKDKNKDLNKIRRICVAGRKLEGSPEEITIDRWLERRREIRRELPELAKFRGSWHKEAHGKLFSAFLKKDNDALLPGYTQDQLNECLKNQSLIHERLILFPRGMRKSTTARLDILQMVLNFPDVVVLVCTSTIKMANRCVKELRSYLEVKDYNNPTDLQCYFPEFCIPAGSGEASEYRCPVAHLDLPNPTISATSVQASTAGVRADYILFDDACDEKNYREVEQRLKIIETFDAVRELLIRPYGFSTTVGTRYTDGDLGDNPEGRGDNESDTRVPDLYGEILLRAKNCGEEDDLGCLIEAAWTPRSSEVAAKKFRDYLPEDVDLLMDDGPGLFTVLKKKAMVGDGTWFRCQQLNQPAAVTAAQFENRYYNTWTKENIEAASFSSAHIPPFDRVQTYIFGDTALTDNRTSDETSYTAVKVENREGDFPLVWFCETIYGHWAEKEKALQLARFMAKWNPTAGVLVEKIPAESVLFIQEVHRQIILHNVHNLPLKWFEPKTERGAKENRQRDLQLLHGLGLVRFIIGPWSDRVTEQLCAYNGDPRIHGKSSKGGRKDDVIDSMSFVLKVLPYIQGVQSDAEKMLAEEALLRKQNAELSIHIFGKDTTVFINPGPTAPPPAPYINPIFREMDKLKRKNQ